MNFVAVVFASTSAQTPSVQIEQCRFCSSLLHRHERNILVGRSRKGRDVGEALWRAQLLHAHVVQQAMEGPIADSEIAVVEAAEPIDGVGTFTINAPKEELLDIL